MRKFMLAAGLAVLLSGCGDDGIYGNYVNQQYGVRLDVQKDVIKFRNGVFTVKSWDESQKPVYIARTQNKDLGSWTFKIEKVKGGVVYQGAVLRKIRGLGNGKQYHSMSLLSKRKSERGSRMHGMSSNYIIRCSSGLVCFF